MLIGIDANEANLTHNRVGVNQYAFDLLWALYKANTPHQYCIYLKTTPQADLPLSRKNWTYRVIPFPKLWTQTRLPWDLYTHTPRPDVFFSMSHYAPRWCPVPSVICIMDLGFMKTPEQFTPKDLNQLKSWTAYSIAAAKKIIAISKFTKQDIHTYFHPQGEVVVSYPSFDVDHFYPRKSNQALGKYGIHKPYILFLSSLKPSKNVPRLIQAFQRLAGDYPDIQLVVAGKKGWLYEEIFSQTKELNIQNKVIFPGFIAESDVPELMSNAEAFAMPSLYEGFGIPVLEAMACGTPVVISDSASLPEVGGSAAIYIDPLRVDSIVTGLKTALGKKRHEFVLAGLKQVKLFSWEKSAAEVLAVLESTH